jgi:hypothetical protein
MKKSIIVLAVILGLIGWSCSKYETVHNLKQSVEKSTAEINTAISTISTTKGYQLLSLSSDAAKSEESFNDSITLGLIAGIYDFQPDTAPTHKHINHPYRLFKRTGNSEKMIINLPERMSFHSKYLHFYSPSDTILKNNFTITASDYHLYYNWWNSYDYKLNAGFMIDSKDIGNMDVTSSSNSYKDHLYSSKYTFTEGYSISADWETGDTTKSSFYLSQNDKILLKETSVFVWNNIHKHEKQYTITIGNVDIKRISGIDSIQVYFNGVLQKQAAAFITDNADSTGSICHKRDILLTFDDGTTAKLSTMIDPALTALRTLIDSLHNMYFAKNIVDYIALNIYYNTH